MTTTSENKHILLVEDNPADIDLIRHVFSEQEVAANITVATNGADALKALQGVMTGSRGKSPDLVLLDLNLPGIGGRDLLAMMKKDPIVRRIPVIVLTSSHSSTEANECYSLGANSFITKPEDFHGLQSIIRAIESFWLSTVTMPPSSVRFSGEG